MTDPHRRTGATMLVIAWMLLFGLAYWFFSEWERDRVNPNRADKLAGQQGALVLERNREGHYLADGEINGHPVTFLLDTGATQVALSPELAGRLGLARGQAIRLMTANGPATGYQSRLATVRIGPLQVHDVGAVITPGMAGDGVLLGMSFLRRVDFAQKGGQLLLAPADAPS
jgi:aspartyl protease family protein